MARFRWNLFAFSPVLNMNLSPGCYEYMLSGRRKLALAKGGTLQEQEAIRQCQAGNLAALGALFELHHQSVFRTSYGIVRRHEIAEDVTQQVFIELFTAIKRYDLRRPFPPWLHRIAVHRSLDEVRRRRTRDVPIEAAGDPPPQSTSPEHAAEESELRATIRNAIGYLEPRHRAAVVLRYYQGFSEAETAVALGCRPGTVKSRVYYALRRLRQILAAGSPPLVAEMATQPTSSQPTSSHPAEAGDRLICASSPDHGEEKL